VRLARLMGISEADCVHIRRGALLHDIGRARWCFAQLALIRLKELSAN
jgi:HD superfamily phosphodiesterase